MFKCGINLIFARNLTYSQTYLLLIVVVRLNEMRPLFNIGTDVRLF